MSAPEGSSGKGGGALSVLEHQLAVDDDVGHADRQLPAIVIGGAVGNLLRIKDAHVSRHAFSQEAPVFQAEATGGVSRQMLHGLLQRPGLVVADMMSQIA